jgi:hypothetical protein
MGYQDPTQKETKKKKNKEVEICTSYDIKQRK